MKSILKSVSLFIISAGISGFAIAATATSTATASATADSAAAVAEKVAEKQSPEMAIRQALTAILGGSGNSIDSISETPISGLYQVTVGSQILYVSSDGKYVVNGDLFESQTSKNLTEPVRAKIRAAAVQEEIDKGGAIVFKAKGETRYRLNVFTDIDCGYCRELHKHIDEFAELGIEVRYLMMPRTAIGAPSYFKAVNALCSKNPQQALTDLKNGLTVEDIRCDDNRVANTMELAQRLGIRGTPGSITESGELIPGYRLPADFLQILESLSKQQ